MRLGTKRVRIAVALLLAGALLGCALFIVAEGHHHCAGDDCAICACIRVCAGILSPLLFITAIGAPGMGRCAALLLGRPLGLLGAATATPVSCRVRIDE